MSARNLMKLSDDGTFYDPLTLPVERKPLRFVEFEVTKSFLERPDIFMVQTYGSYDFWPIFCYLNGIGHIQEVSEEDKLKFFYPEDLKRFIKDNS